MRATKRPARIDIAVVFLVAASLFTTTSAIASQLFTTGSPNQAGARLGDRNTGFFDLAQSFTLPVGGTSVTDLHWWGLCAFLEGEAVVTSCEGTDSFDVAIRSDAGGLPGSVVATLLAGGSANRAPTGELVFDTFTEYAYSIDFSPVELSAGTRYWLEISNAASVGRWFWEETNPSASFPSAFRSTDTAGNWAPLSSTETPVVTFAMTVTGNQGSIPVPEPESLALLAVALVASGFASRHRRP